MVAGVKPSGKPVGPVGIPPIAAEPPVPGGTVMTLVPPEPAEVVPPVPTEVVPPLLVPPELCVPPEATPFEGAVSLLHPIDETTVNAANPSPNNEEFRDVSNGARMGSPAKTASNVNTGARAPPACGLKFRL